MCCVKKFMMAMLFLMPALSAWAAEDSWKVLIPGLPERVFAADEWNSTSFYILKQTHEPIFRWADGENFSSKLLDEWSRSLDYTRFKFCPRRELEFAAGGAFGFEDFAVLVSSFTSGYSSHFEMRKDDRCVYISFDSPKKDYLHFWTLYRNAPTRRVGINVEAGLGSFYVKSMSKDKISLSRGGRVRGGYNAVEFLNYKGGDDERLNDRSIQDFNMIPPAAIPEWIKSTSLSFENPEMKTLVLIINHPDQKVRSRVYNCIDIKSLREAYFPGKMDYYDVATILPMGVPGAIPGLPGQRCDESGAVYGRLRFANWMTNNKTAMERFASDFKARSGLAMRVDQYDMSGFAQAIGLRPRPFDLAIIMVYVASSPGEFFQMFFNKGELYDFEVPRLSAEYRILPVLEKELAMGEIYRKLAMEIADHALALPVSQGRRTLYYPKEIKNFNVGAGIAEYPEVAEFRR